MARTRGGGVVSGVSSRSRRNIGKPRFDHAADGSGVTGAPGAGMQTALPAQQPPAAARGAGTGAVDSLGRNSHGARRRENERLPSTSPSGGSDQPLPHKEDSQVMRRGSFAAGMSTGLDGDDDLDDIFGLFEDPIGDEPGMRDAPAGTDKYTGSSGRSTGSMSHRKCRPLAAVRKSPLSPPKIPVWRMLYVDPDVSDPKLVAGLLEKVASRALRCGCVFDVATDIVEALADVRGDTMWVYRGVFINESLYRHKTLDHGKGMDMSIQGKHLSQFFRQVGMSGARIVLLVAGDVHFDTADAGAHGLSAVLRKPFTKDGFSDILRGMYLSDEPAGVVEAPPDIKEPVQAAQRKATSSSSSSTPYPCPTVDSRHAPSLPSQPQRVAKARQSPAGDHPSKGLAAAANAPTARPAAAVIHGGPPSILPPSAYPACLGFTPFPHPMMNRYLVSGLLRPGQVGPRRKYTKIAPREEGEEASVAPPTQVLEGLSAGPSCSPAVAIVNKAEANVAAPLPSSGQIESRRSGEDWVGRVANNRDALLAPQKFMAQSAVEVVRGEQESAGVAGDEGGRDSPEDAVYSSS